MHSMAVSENNSSSEMLIIFIKKHKQFVFGSVSFAGKFTYIVSKRTELLTPFQNNYILKYSAEIVLMLITKC